MRVKLFFIIFILLISFGIVIGESNLDNDLEIYEEREISQCVEELKDTRIGDAILSEESAISACAKVVGTMLSMNVNKIRTDDNKFLNIVFPFEDNVLRVQDIPCDNPGALTIGFFNPDTLRWVALDTEVEVNEGERLSDNTYSFITKNLEQSRIVEFLGKHEFLYFALLKRQPPITLTMDCIENICDFTRGIYTQDGFTDPFDSRISFKGLYPERFGQEYVGSNMISFRVCGLPPGCDPSDETCDPRCTVYSSEHCARIYDGYCSNQGGDCCNPAHDGVCDPDCPYGVDPDCICSIEDDDCCIGFGPGILLAPSGIETKILSPGLCGYLGYYTDECEINPDEHEDLFVKLTEREKYWFINRTIFNVYQVLGDPNCAPQFYSYPEMDYSIYGLIGYNDEFHFGNVFRINDKNTEVMKDLYRGSMEEITELWLKDFKPDSKYFNYAERLKTKGIVPVTEVTEELELLQEIYKDFIYLNVDACDYSVDGKCCEFCPSYEIEGVEFNPVKGEYEDAIVTWHADPDCCELEKWEFNENTNNWEVVGSGPMAATNKQDGCCKPVCDGVCDPDCLPGLDPDCSPEFHVSPMEMIEYIDARMERYSDRSRYYSSEPNQYYSVTNPTISNQAKCVGCGNGRCEFYVWGGGRVAWPTMRNVWMTTPSLHDIASNNWYYISQDYPELTNPALTYPINIFIERRFYNEISVFCGHNFGGMHGTDGKIHADCVRIFYKDTITGNLERKRREKGFGHKYDGWDYGGTYYDHPWGWTHANNWLYDKNPLQLNEYNALHSWFIENINLQYNSWPTFYPFDQDPDNCPEDCGIELTCGNGICEPWEIEGGKYPCPQDCVEVIDDYDWPKYPLMTMFRMAQMDDYHERDYDDPKAALMGKGYCITSQNFYYHSDVSRSNIEKTLKYLEIGSSPLCAFAHPGEKGNCPAGMVCDETCRCVSLNDVKIVRIDETLFETNNFYYSLYNMIDMDLDSVPDYLDCNPRNTKISPLAVEVCDGMDTNCDGTIDSGDVCQKIIHVCKTYDLGIDVAEEGCFDSWCVCDPERNPEGCVALDISNLDGCFVELGEMEPGNYPYYLYVCEPGEPCTEPLKSSNFTVLPLTEDYYEHGCEDGIDNDGDGLIDMQDPDCWTCEPGECRLTLKKWCSVIDGEAQLIEEGYCQMCAHIDSTCSIGMEDVEPCEEGEKSCDGGCLPGACDIETKLVCNEEGYWTAKDYNTLCFAKDSELSTEPGECKNHACDVVNNKTCIGLHGMPTNWISAHYCTAEMACGWQTDYDCRDAEKSCIDGMCDIEYNAFCDKGTWVRDANYCNHCGAIDSDCGFRACEEGRCDFIEQKMCIGGKWVFLSQEEYCLERNCGTAPDPNYICTEPEIEEGKECFPGRTQKCGHSEVGICTMGEQTCNEQGFWGECIGAIWPREELCNGFDNNCDGSIDVGCPCTVGEIRACGSLVGECSPGIQICTNAGVWGPCGGQAYRPPEEEKCDGTDNNCNGIIDEGCDCIEGTNRTCGSDVGECRKGVQYCTEGRWGPCIGEIGPVQQVGILCHDGKDNNCNGFVDMNDESCQALQDHELSPTCFDGIQNQGEEGIDCGGPCPPCEEVTCNDGKRNGDEEGIDCGGSFCPPCNPNDPTLLKPSKPPVEDDYEPIEVEEVVDRKIPFGLIFAIIILLALLGGGGYLFWSFKKSGKPFNQFYKDSMNKIKEMINQINNKFKKEPKKETVQPQQEQKQQTPVQPTPQKPSAPPRRIRPRARGIERDIEESFSEAERLFKKRKE